MKTTKENVNKEKLIKKLQKENEELRERLENREEQIQQYKKDLANNSVVERWQIGKYLHDNLAQQLLSVKITISILKDELSNQNIKDTYQEMINILDKSIDEVRDLSHDIIPMNVETEGVGQAFKHLKEQAEKQYGINCKLETENKLLHKINRRQVATNLYHIAQEAIKNAVTHGEANNIKVALIEHDQQLYLHIKDDGKGFESTSGKSGMGTAIMKHRTEKMGGQLKIREAKEDSKYHTLVTCTIPLSALEDK